MVVNCEQVWLEISNYLDNDLDPSLRAAIEEHVRGCKNCQAVLDGARNVVQLYGDKRMVEIPLGFDRRFRRRMEDDMSGGRRVFFGWMVAAATAAVAVAAFKIGNLSFFRRPELRSEHAREGNSIPPDLMVVVAEDGKTFHVETCPYIHDRARLRSVTAKEAMQEGYAPCVRCMKKYLTAEALPDSRNLAQTQARSTNPSK